MADQSSKLQEDKKPRAYWASNLGEALNNTFDLAPNGVIPMVLFFGLILWWLIAWVLKAAVSAVEAGPADKQGPL